MPEIPKTYEPPTIEPKWYAFWEDRGCFAANPARVSEKRPAYSIVIPPPNVTGVLTLATYHRSKGREWPRVFLFEHAARCPSRAARQAWQQVQEANLAYVAITRAKQTLAYVN